ncbi:hypothetical protein ACIBF1_08860 [Spirillospora sp. NPDC050679]
MPVLLRGLLDEVAGPEALRVLRNVSVNGVLHISAAMPAILPFLIRLASVPDIALRTSLPDLLVIAAALSSPVDPDDEHGTPLLGRTAATRTPVVRGHLPHMLPPARVVEG